MTLGTCGAVAVIAASVAASSPAKGRSGPGGLRYSTASNVVVQAQPAPGSCHARGRGPYARPDRRCTPGALNPAVTQATIEQTICRSGWTATVRPSESVTEREKYASMAAYGDAGPASAFEYDHFVPLELGGATNDPHNLWPEPGGSPNRKDTVENHLKDEVCQGRLTLARAQKLIVSDWSAVYRTIRKATAPTGNSQAPAHCSASAAWNVTYGDYDVYVHSNQPGATATVTAAGATAGYRTNASGYADVYLRASRAAAGDRVSVSVGSARCYTTL